MLVQSGDDELAHTAIYLHIPFCRTKCSYCDFNTYANLEPLIPRYVEALCAEVRRHPRCLPAHTLNFGGGTPSLLSGRQLATIIGACREWFTVTPEAEVSIEANPGGLDEGYFQEVKAAGVNRLSFGVQSLHGPELVMLTRRHSAEEAVEALAAARRAGYENVNLDFMYGLPGQSLERWRATLKAAIELRPEHLSLYGLTVYDHLPLGEQVRSGRLPGQDDDLMADMYELAEDLLETAGYDHYEISNWAAEPRFACRHNLAYWRNTGYLGLGAGAHSYFAGQRYANESKPARFCDLVLAGEDPAIERELVTTTMTRAETVILGLRLRQGAVLLPSEFERLGACLDAGLLDMSGSHARLTRKGRLLSNEVFWRLLPDASVPITSQ